MQDFNTNEFTVEFDTGVGYSVKARNPYEALIKGMNKFYKANKKHAKSGQTSYEMMPYPTRMYIGESDEYCVNLTIEKDE